MKCRDTLGEAGITFESHRMNDRCDPRFVGSTATTPVSSEGAGAFRPLNGLA